MVLNFLRKQNKNTTLRVWLGKSQIFPVPRLWFGNGEKISFCILILTYLRNSGNYTRVIMEQRGQFSLEGEGLRFVGAERLFGQGVTGKGIGA